MHGGARSAGVQGRNEARADHRGGPKNSAAGTATRRIVSPRDLKPQRQPQCLQQHLLQQQHLLPTLSQGRSQQPSRRHQRGRRRSHCSLVSQRIFILHGFHALPSTILGTKRCCLVQAATDFRVRTGKAISEVQKPNPKWKGELCLYPALSHHLQPHRVHFDGDQEDDDRSY